MEKIPSFNVNHLTLLRGVYVSRMDVLGDQVLTTFDLRMTRPNLEPVMNTAEMHAIEHLGATYLRNAPELKDRVIYFGPMGCRTGFYLILAGRYTPNAILDDLVNLYTFIQNYDDAIPGASARDCGNYLDMNLPMAKWLAKRYLDETLLVITDAMMTYPD